MERPRIARLFTGGTAANAQLTSLAATALVVLLAVESATLLNLRALLTVHAFVGMLLIPVIALKLASTGWRMLRYYRGAAAYVAAGPPHVALRVLISPLTVVSTVALFGTGVALLVLGQTQGTLVTLHKASFIVWLGATGLHVLAHIPTVLRALKARIPGLAVRGALVAASILAGALLATATFPAADRLQDNLSSSFGLDSH